MINGNNVILFELEMDSGAVTVKYDIQSRYNLLYTHNHDHFRSP